MSKRPNLFLAVLLIAGCQRASSDAPPLQTPNVSASTMVSIVAVERTAIHREVSNPGAIEAFEETPLYGKVAGYVQKWDVDIGDRVCKDQVLAVLWVPELEEELKQKEAHVEQAEAQIAQARAAEKAAEAAYKSAATQIEVAEAGRKSLLALRNRTRMQHLRLDKLSSAVMDRENVEEARLGYETAQAGVIEVEAKIKAAHALREEAKAKWDKAVADVRAAEAHRKVDEKDRDYVLAQWQYTRLTAPYDSVVTQRGVNRGDFVRSAATGKDKPLYTVRRSDLMRLVVQVPESDAAWVEKGSAASVRVPALPARTFNGAVTRISWSLDETTRTLRAEIDLPNADGQLRPGMYAYATLSAATPHVTTLPRSAVRTEGDVTRGYQHFCYQVENGKTRRLLLELGAGDRQRVEVLRKRLGSHDPWQPLTGTELIVRDNLSQLRDGQTVTIQTAKP